jgi:hypothetical protein
MPFQIKHPKDGKTYLLPSPPSVIFASGRADAATISIVGSCQLQGQAPPPPSKGSAIALCHPEHGHVQDKRWTIPFKIMQPSFGTYALSVTEYDASFRGTTHNITFTLEQKRELLGVTIGFPSSGDQIDSEDFNPYGDLTASLASITLQRAGDPPVPLSYVFQDPAVLQFWCAQFDPIPLGPGYSLIVVDVMGNMFPANNLEAV